MPHLSIAQLRELTAKIFVAAGADADLADQVAGVLAENHLAGHDSHGVLRLPQYVAAISAGTLNPRARPEIVRETETTALVSGNWTFGQVAATFAVDVAVDKALRHQVAAVAIVEMNHTGRLAAFTDRAARHGVVTFMFAGSGARYTVAPYGGAEPALGTNPLAISVPNGDEFAVTLDFATAAVAAGKVKLAKARGTMLPAGAVVDRDGQPTTDPEAYFTGGHLVPFGGHKGYALSVLTELLSGPLTGADEYARDTKKTGGLILALHAGAFRSPDSFQRATAGVVRRIGEVSPATGFERVLVPGEPEATSRRARAVDGVEVAAATWAAICAAAAEVGLEPAGLIG